MKDFKTPPHDKNAEASILCSLIRHPEFELKNERLQPSFFFYPENAEIYKAIKTLVGKGMVERIDERSLLSQLTMSSDTENLFYGEVKEKIKYIVDYASEMDCETEEAYKILVDIVTGLGFKRKAVHELQKLLSSCMNCRIDDIDKINTDMIDTANNLATNFITGDEIDYFGKKMDRLRQQMLDRRNPDGTYGIPTPWKSLNEYISFEMGELIVFQAQRKKGKSVIALNVTLALAKAGINVVYFETEMQDLGFLSRLCSHATGIPEKRIKNDTLTHEERVIYDETFEYLKTLPIVHEYRCDWTKEGIVTQAKILKNKNKCDIFIYDYLKENESGSLNAADRARELGKWTDTIKNKIGGALEIPTIAFAQLTEDNKIATSKEIERYASCGIIWDYKTPEEIVKHGKECGNSYMKVSYNRIGGFHDEYDKEDYIDFQFTGEILTIQETKQQHTKDPETPFDGE